MRASIVSAALVMALATGAAPAATRTFPVGAFDRVRSSVPFDVHVHTGGAPAVHALGDDDRLARLRVSVVRGELVIEGERGGWFRSFTWRKGKTVVVNVTVPRLAGVSLAGPGNLSVDMVRAPAFSAALSGPGDLAIGRLEAGRLDLSLIGPGDITVAGKAGHASIVGKGPGDVRATGLSVDDLEVDLMGPGDVTVTANHAARIRLAGPGDVRVLGHPRCAVTKHGPGDVVCGG